jgi:hypothetical protein
MIVRVLTSCHAQYTSDSSICIFDVIMSLASVCCWEKRVRYCPAVRESVTDRSDARTYGE